MTDAAATVSKKVESAIIYRMRIRALSKCEPLTKAFAECTEARLLSIVWACRPQLNALNECTKQHTGPEVMEGVKRRWVSAGRPRDPDWDTLFEGLS